MELQQPKAVIIAAIIAATVAIIGTLSFIYINTPSDFIINLYPNTQYDVSITNGHFELYQARSTPANPNGFYIESMTMNNGSIGFGGSVRINDLYWYKKYSYPVTLKALSTPPGINISFENTVGSTPFSSEIYLEILPNTTLASGPHYLTIRGIGQDGKERDCTCTLMNHLDRKGGPSFIRIDYGNA